VGYRVLCSGEGVGTVYPNLEVLSLSAGRDATGRTVWRNEMAAPAPIIKGSGTTLVARLKVLATLTEGLRARTGPPTPRSVSWHLPLSRPVHSLADDPAWHRPPVGPSPSVDLAGLPVLVIGGLATSPQILSPLQDWLHGLGCRTLLAPPQCGIACGQRAAIAVEEALARHVDTTGEQAVIIAHSRGGQFARPVAVRRPELLRGLIALGSPLNRLLGVHPLVLLKVLGLGVGGSLGIPGLFRASCLWGQCCRPLRDDLWGSFPEQVPFLSVFSRHDEVVPWQASLDPAARHREILTTHRGLITSQAAFQLLAHELTLFTDQKTHPNLTSRAQTHPAHIGATPAQMITLIGSPVEAT
jgi:triacylglycerol lipase